jgi:hypothetical protein
MAHVSLSGQFWLGLLNWLAEPTVVPTWCSKKS